MVLRALSQAARTLGFTDRKILVAVSGGVDSTVLAAALGALRRPLGLALVIGHVDHGLRGAGSDADGEAVRVLAGKLDLEVRVSRVDPEALRSDRGSRARPTLQEAARRVRYDALLAQADAAGADHIATAHTRDDQAETVLLRLLRGAGPDGLAGIPERSPDGRILRPLLGVSRSEVEAYARESGLSWREDPTNRDSRYARSRLRNEWIPGLREAFNPHLLRAVADLAEAQRRDAEWIAEHVERQAMGLFEPIDGGLRIAQEPWLELPEALARRLVRRALRELGASRNVTRTHLLRALGFLRTGRVGATLELPGGLRLRREDSCFVLTTNGLPPLGAC